MSGSKYVRPATFATQAEAQAQADLLCARAGWRCAQGDDGPRRDGRWYVEELEPDGEFSNYWGSEPSDFTG